MFIGLLTSIANAFNHKNCVFLGNRKCTTQLTLINIVLLNTLKDYVTMYLRFISCYTLNDLSKKVYVPNAIEALNLNVFNMIAGINESTSLTDYISCRCKFRFDGRKLIQIKKGITINVNVSEIIWKNIMCTKKIMFEILLHVVKTMVNILQVLLMSEWLDLTKLLKKQKLFQQK